MSLLINELKNMVDMIDNLSIVEDSEILRVNNLIKKEVSKDILKNMIVFVKEYLKINQRMFAHGDSFVFGGFVRDWCFPCMAEGFDCMNKRSVDMMFNLYPDFEIPSDIDIVDFDFPLYMLQNFFPT